MKAYFDLLAAIARGFVRPSHPSYLVLFVTARCNCRCAICFNAQNVLQGPRLFEMDLAAIEKIARSTYPLPQLLLSGGEPFLRQDIADIVHLFYSYAGTRQISIPTNGTLTEATAAAVADILARCPTAFVNVNLSLDEIGASHDALRGLEGCFARLCSTYQELAAVRDQYPRLSINFLTVIRKETISRAKDIRDYVREHFQANYHAMNVVRGNVEGYERGVDPYHCESRSDASVEDRDSFRELPVFNRLGPVLAARVHSAAARSRQERRRCFRCLAGTKMIVVTSDGLLYPCEPLWLEPEARDQRPAEDFLVARLSDFDFDVARALRTERARRIRRFVAKKICWCDYGCAILNGMMYSPSCYLGLALECLRPHPTERPGK